MRQISKKVLAALLCGSGLLAAARAVRRHLLRRPATVILCYHRIGEEDLLFAPVRTSLNNFHAQVTRLKEHFAFASLADLGAALGRGHLPNQDTAVFTFDDGYRSCLPQTVAILRQYGARGTFFVATGPLFDRQPYWLDRLGQLLDTELAAPTAPGKFAAIFTAGDYRRLRRGTFTERQQVTKRLLGDLFSKQLSAERRAQLAELLTTEVDVSQPERQVVTVAELRQLQEDGQDIGAHTVSHPRLADLAEIECRTEIATAIATLRGAGLEISSFAYPFGKPAEIGKMAPTILKCFGITTAVTTVERPVALRDDLHLLPRFVVADQPASLLLCRLEWRLWKNILTNHERKRIQ